MKKKVISFIVAVSLAVPTALGAFPRFMEGAAENTDPSGPVEINEENFPDDAFREYILAEKQRIADELGAGEEEEGEEVAEEEDEEGDEAADEEAYPTLSAEEIELITNIDVQDMAIWSLQGIEYLTSVVSLNCSENELMYLDISTLTNLEELMCEGNSLYTLDLSGNPNLKTLNCDYNYISDLVLGESALSLTDISCEYNSLTDIDLEGAAAIETLHLNGNQIEDIDITMLSELTDLQISGNKLTELDLSGNTKISTVYCAENYLTDIDLSLNPQLAELNVSKNRLTVLDVSNNQELTYLDCSFNNLTSLDLKANESLEKLYSGENRYTILSCHNEAFDYVINDLVEKLPSSFDVIKTSNWSGADRTEDGTTFLNIENGVTEITYTYNMGNGYTETFTLAFKEGHHTKLVEDTSSLCIDKDTVITDLWQCSDCERYFTDEAATMEVTDLVGEEHIPVELDGSEFELDFFQHWQICARCGEEYNLGIHEMDHTTNSCTVCGRNFDNDHSFEDHVYWERTEATCTEDGMEAHFYCQYCKNYYKYVEDGHIIPVNREDLIHTPALGHDYAATSYDKENDEYNEEYHWLECTRCHEIKEDSIEEHIISETGNVVKEANCGEDGVREYPCEKCDYAEKEVIPSNGEHSFNKTFKNLPELDQCVIICDVCGTEQTDIDGELMTHDHDDDIDILPATCYRGAIEKHTCKNCNRYYEKENGAPTGEHNIPEEYKYNAEEHWKNCENEGCPFEQDREEHDLVEEVLTPPTEDNPGVYVHVCTVCGYRDNGEWVDPIEPGETTKPEQPAPKPDETTVPEQPAPKPDETTAPEKPEPTPDVTTAPEKPEPTPDVTTAPEKPEPTPDVTTAPEKPEPTPDETTAPEQPAPKPDETTAPEPTQPTQPQPTWPIEPQPTQPSPEQTTTQPAQTTPPEKDPVVTKPTVTNSAPSDPFEFEPDATVTTSKEPDVAIPDNTTTATNSPAAENTDNNIAGNVNGAGDSGNKGDNNISTGLVISMIPAAISGAGVVIFRKREQRSKKK